MKYSEYIETWSVKSVLKQRVVVLKRGMTENHAPLSFVLQYFLYGDEQRAHHQGNGSQ